MSRKAPDPPPPPGISPQDAFAFMQKMWNPFGMPIPGFGVPNAPVAAPEVANPFANMMGGMPFPNPAAMFATLDPAEIERKIGELKVIEGWLTMSLNLIQMSVKTMELQKASLEAMRATHAPASAKPGPGRRQP